MLETDDVFLHLPTRTWHETGVHANGATALRARLCCGRQFPGHISGAGHRDLNCTCFIDLRRRTGASHFWVDVRPSDTNCGARAQR
eukprot:6136070-Heterocapsa_arctica.AAC.1